MVNENLSKRLLLNSEKMMDTKLSGIPETLLIPLWARAAATQRINPIIRDEKAVEMVSRIDYDFSRFEKSHLTETGVAIRTMLLDNALSVFLKDNPDSIIINLGAGLDTRHERMNPQQADWFEIDLPEAISLRKQFFSETEHYHFIPQSMFESTWIQQVNRQDKPVMILAEGLFMYFSQDELKPLFVELAESLPGAEMVFEMVAPFLVGRSKQHETVRKIDSSAEFKWSLKNTRTIEDWHPSIRFIEEWNYFDYYKKKWGMFGLIARLPIIRPHFASRMVHARLLAKK